MWKSSWCILVWNVSGAVWCKILICVEGFCWWRQSISGAGCWSYAVAVFTAWPPRELGGTWRCCCEACDTFQVCRQGRSVWRPRWVYPPKNPRVTKHNWRNTQRFAFWEGNLEFGGEITEIHISPALFYRCLQVASGVFDRSVDMTTDAVER